MQTKKLRYLLLFAVIAIAATVVWYFAYWVKTPQYSLGLIGTAVQKHDFAAFEKHVDMGTLYSSAYDDVVVASFGNERLSSPILAALVQNIKGVAVPILIDQTRQYINGGAMEEADPSDADSPMMYCLVWSIRIGTATPLIFCTNAARIGLDRRSLPKEATTTSS